MATLADLSGLRATTEDVVLLAQQDAAATLRSVDVANLRAGTPGLRAAVGEVIYGYGFGLAAVAADWYSDARAESPAIGRFVPVPRVPLTDDDLASLVGWSLGPLYDEHPDMRLAIARLDGGVQRTVTNAARETIIENTRRDPVRPSYYRGASANCCAFCAMLTTRVYTRRASADFSAHDHDRCFPVAVWPGEGVALPPYYGDFQQEYDDAAEAARRAGESVTAKSVLWRMRQATGRK